MKIPFLLILITIITNWKVDRYQKLGYNDIA